MKPPQSRPPGPRGPRSPGSRPPGERRPGAGGDDRDATRSSAPGRPFRPERPARDAAKPQARPPIANGREDGGQRLSIPRPRPEARPEQGSERPRGERPRPAGALSGPRPGPDAPRGAVWLYGTHAVAAALGNPARRLRRLLLTEEAEAAIAARLRQPWPLPTERAERGRLDQLLGRDTVHQGAALLADPLAPPALAQVLERSGPVIVLDQVADPRNVGAILRSAAAFGAACVITQERNAPEETGALAKAASGALETIPLLRAVNIARTLVALKAAGCWVVGLDAGGAGLSGPALAERRVALVLGSEGDGLRRLTRDTCDEVAGLAMSGAGRGLDSLNVAAAAAVALYELGRPA